MSEIKPECKNLADDITAAIILAEQVLDSLRAGKKYIAEQYAEPLWRQVDKLIPNLGLTEGEIRTLIRDSESIKKTVPFYTDPTPKNITVVEGQVRSVQGILLSAGLTQVAACQCNPCK